jgi:type II secretory pathway component PulC
VFRDESLRRKSVYALCGIRSGDVWTRVNSRSLATPEEALELYGKLRENDQLVIDLVRSGKNIQLQITFR